MGWLCNLFASLLGRRHLSWCAICAYHEYRWLARCPRCGSKMHIDRLRGART